MKLEIVPEWIDGEGRAYSWRVVDMDGEIWGETWDGKRILAPLSQSFDHANQAFDEKLRLEAGGFNYYLDH